MDSEPIIEILFLSLDYPPNDGGISRLSAGLAKTLLDKGCAIKVITFSSDSIGGLSRPQVNTLEVVRWKVGRDLQMIRNVRKVNRNTRILCSVWNPEATIALLAGARRVSILAHGNEVMKYNGKTLRTWLRRLILEKARVVICNSFFTESLVKNIAPKARTAVLNPAIHAEKLRVPFEKPEVRRKLGLTLTKKILLTVARLDAIKGHETVLRAISELDSQQRSDLHYVIVGKGDMLDPLIKLTKQLDIQELVQFAGFIPDTDLPLWYRASDLFVLPSIVDPTRRGMEGFGMAFSEAQAAGLAVIGTRSGGIPDAVSEGDGGFLIDENDFEALAEHFRHLLLAPEFYENQGCLGAARMDREFSWDNYATRLLELI